MFRTQVQPMSDCIPLDHDAEPPYTKAERTEPPFMFEWCVRCSCLKVCYYQHGERNLHPMALDPSCAEGPA